MLHLIINFLLEVLNEIVINRIMDNYDIICKIFDNFIDFKSLQKTTLC